MARKVGKAVMEDPDAMSQLVKEVWSRGGTRERRLAADAVGRGLGRSVPHKAMAAARELARMARNRKEAEMVGELAFEPILEQNPALVERVKVFIKENETLLRQAAIASLIMLAKRRKKHAAVVLQGLLLVAESKEDEIRKATRKGLGELSKVDARATAKAVTAWARSDPTKERVAVAKQAVKAAPAKTRSGVEKIVFAGLEKVANGSSRADASRSRNGKKGAKRGRS
jgi:hypothetical protein